MRFFSARKFTFTFCVRFYVWNMQAGECKCFILKCTNMCALLSQYFKKGRCAECEFCWLVFRGKIWWLNSSKQVTRLFFTKKSSPNGIKLHLLSDMMVLIYFVHTKYVSDSLTVSYLFMSWEEKCFKGFVLNSAHIKIPSLPNFLLKLMPSFYSRRMDSDYITAAENKGNFP